MLSFNSAADYTALYTCLAAAVEANADAFESQYSGLSDDDYNDMADQLGFEETQPLIDFESSAGFQSYRNWFYAEEETWLAGGNTPSSMPYANIFHDDVTATLRNKYGAVMIAGIIYLRDKYGVDWTFCDCETYMTYINNPASISPNDPCVTKRDTKALFEGNGTTCSDFWYQCDERNCGSNHLYRMYLLFGWSPGENNTQVYSEIRHFKWKSNRWKPRRMKMTAGGYGSRYTLDCVDKASFYLTPKTKRRRKVYAGDWFSAHDTFQNLTVHGNWSYDGCSNSFALDYVNMPLSTCP